MKTKYNTTLLLAIHLFLLSCGESKHFIKETTNDKSLQEKYAVKLDVSPENIQNIELYHFIDKWLGVPYLLGGENEKGIDCSSFAQHLYKEVYNHLIERTANKQYRSIRTDKFIGKEFLKEGDLLFFKNLKSKDNTVTHVGIYLMNNKFISATSYKGPSKNNGVKISDITLPYWKQKFVGAGRRKIEKYTN